MQFNSLKINHVLIKSNSMNLSCKYKLPSFQTPSFQSIESCSESYLA